MKISDLVTAGAAALVGAACGEAGKYAMVGEVPPGVKKLKDGAKKLDNYVATKIQEAEKKKSFRVAGTGIFLGGAGALVGLVALIVSPAAAVGSAIIYSSAAATTASIAALAHITFAPHSPKK